MTSEQKMHKPISKEDPAVDLEFLREATAGDRDFEHELFTLFLDSTKTAIEKFERAFKEKNEDVWYATAHSIKGSSSSIGAFYLSKIAEYAQLHPKEEDDKKSKVLTDLKAEFARVSEFINRELMRK